MVRIANDGSVQNLTYVNVNHLTNVAVIPSDVPYDLGPITLSYLKIPKDNRNFLSRVEMGRAMTNSILKVS